MINESESVEFKEILKDDICKEVVAFANAEGGTIYIGIDDQGREVGIQNINQEYARLTNLIRDNILPDVTLFIKYELKQNNIIKVTVSEGFSKPYYLKKNGIKPSGVYVRQGSSTSQTTWDNIRRLIKNSDGDSFEMTRSIQQDLTFNYSLNEFKSHGVDFYEEKYVQLGLKSFDKGLYTNLALLLSDQCFHTIKVAVFDDTENTKFIDRREFEGSVFKQLHETYEYLMLNNRTLSEIKGLNRIDKMDYPPEALREALLNSMTHRDYSFSGSIIININSECMEFISLGGLLPGLSANDIMNGISQSRNPKLANVFFRLKHIEAYGTGIRRIYNLYKSSYKKPVITVSENSFRLTLPNSNFYSGEIEKYENNEHDTDKNKKITEQMEKIMKYIESNGFISEDMIKELLKIERTRAYYITKQMMEMKLINVIGRGKEKKYIDGK